MSLARPATEEESFEYDFESEHGAARNDPSEELEFVDEVLCAERVGQMTKTYNDIDAVTRLLEEKERDLELAARIGQSLLKKNKTLAERNEYLEEQVGHIREEVSQLRHELSMKDELLQFYTSAAEESEPESICSTPLKRNESSTSVQNYFHFDNLQKKLKDLEDENIVLRSEACHLQTETITYEEKEQQLVNDCVKELREASIQISSISEELARKTEDAARQQEEITHLLSQIVDLQKKAKSYAVENEELVQHLGAAKDAQRQLTAELRELEDKYAECMEMLHEAQEELKNLRNKTMPNVISRRYHTLGLFPMDSLAAEIEGSMRKELQMDEPESPELDSGHQKRVFETVRNINLVVKQRSLASSPMNIPGSNQSSALNSVVSSCISTPRSSFYGGDITNIVGFIGAGKMAYGILKGMLLAGQIPAENVLVSAPSDRNLGKFKDHGCRTTHSNVTVLKECKVVFLATKPHIVPGVLKGISPAVTGEHTVISLAAGITLQTLESLLPQGTKVLRAMPNLPCVVQTGAVVFARGHQAGDRQTSLLKALMSKCGLCEEVPESYIDIHTGLSGSGVAYVYMFAEALMDGAVKMGMTSDLANRIAAQTLMGAAKMIQETGDHPAKLRNDVCTPGGTTIYALHELEKGGLRATVMNAVEAATTRAREMGKQ